MNAYICETEIEIEKACQHNYETALCKCILDVN